MLEQGDSKPEGGSSKTKIHVLFIENIFCFNLFFLNEDSYLKKTHLAKKKKKKEKKKGKKQLRTFNLF